MTMDSPTLINIKGLSKTFSPSLSADLLPLWKKVRGKLQIRSEKAILNPVIQDLSIQIARGECLAITGENGSGKSTLLKLIARVTPPSDGFIEVAGSMICLLEAGSGFHPELTVNENLFLVSSFHGFSRAQIKPVIPKILNSLNISTTDPRRIKNYSTGTILKIALELALELSPDILLLDETLSLLHTDYRNKVIKRLKLLLEKGSCILITTHDDFHLNNLITKRLEIKSNFLA